MHKDDLEWFLGSNPPCFTSQKYVLRARGTLQKLGAGRQWEREKKMKWE